MKILYYFTDYQIPMYQWQHIHIIDELKRHNVYIHIFNPLDYDNKDIASEELLKYIKSNRIDLFMTPHNEEKLEIDVLRQIKDYGIPTLLICFDNLIVPFTHYKIAPYFDLVWLTSQETEELFTKRGCNTIFLPYAANPFLLRGEETIEGVGFVGTPYGSRANMINTLQMNKVPVYCHYLKEKNSSSQISIPERTISKLEVIIKFLQFEQGRKIIEGAVVNKFRKTATLFETEYLHKEMVVLPEKLYQVYTRYALALSSTAARNTGVLRQPLDIVNLRSFEIPMAGGLQICRYTDEMASYFEEDKEILFYRNNSELIDKVQYYCSSQRKNEREQMRQAARKRAIENHTWFCRFRKVFETFNLRVDKL